MNPRHKMMLREMEHLLSPGDRHLLAEKGPGLGPSSSRLLPLKIDWPETSR